MNINLENRTYSRRQVMRQGSLSGIGVLIAPNVVRAQATPAGEPSPEDILRETEARRLQSLVDFDMEVADALHADDFQLINPAGGALSKGDYLGGLESGFLDYVVFEPVSEIAVHVYADAAALRYQSTIEMHVGEDFIDTGQFWHTDLYEMRSSGWQVVWSQATRIE